jgi:diphthine synthase
MGKLVFIGLGIDEGYITLKGMEEAKKCDKLFAEFYTSKVFRSLDFGKDIEVLGREEVEDGRRILDEAEKKRVALLVPGDPMAATTHLQLRLEAKKRGIDVKIICGVSIFSAVPSLLGLQHYKFGRTVSLPWPRDGFFPKSPYNSIKENQPLHTLVLLDTEPQMSANEGIKILLAIEKEERTGVLKEDRLVCVVARAGSDDCTIKAGRAGELVDFNFGATPHAIVIPGELHFMEEESLRLFM